MSTGLEVFSAIATVIQTLDVVVQFMRRLYDAHGRRQNLAKVLQDHEQELMNIIQILKVVNGEKLLQVEAIAQDLDQLRLHGQSLHTFLQNYGKDRAKLKEYANQFFNGQKNIEDLGGIMASMSRTKSNLIIKIQVIHVGLTRSFGDVVVVNCQLIETLDLKLRNVFGDGNGLKLAEQLRHKPRRGDGTIHLDNEEYASLKSSTLGGGGNLLAGSTGTSRRVERNLAGDQSFQLNAPVGIGGFTEVDHLVIVDNKASDKSMQINHAISRDDYRDMLRLRLESWEVKRFEVKRSSHLAPFI